jgi:hypothetical protein
VHGREISRGVYAGSAIRRAHASRASKARARAEEEVKRDALEALPDSLTGRSFTEWIKTWPRAACAGVLRTTGKTE